MNHNELITVISTRTGLSSEECNRVIKTFEQVLTEGLKEKKWKSGTFDFILKMMNSIKKDKDGQNATEKK